MNLSTMTVSIKGQIRQLDYIEFMEGKDIGRVIAY